MGKRGWRVRETRVCSLEERIKLVKSVTWLSSEIGKRTKGTKTTDDAVYYST
jgi:hypothetical protein